MLRSIYSIYQLLHLKVYRRLSTVVTKIVFYLNHIKHGSFTCLGVPLIDIDDTGVCEFGDQLTMVSKDKFATLGKSNRCKIKVSKNAKLLIGSKVAMSNTTIVATTSISLGNNIMIGGGVSIVDTDFHSLNPTHWHQLIDEDNMKRLPVTIGDNVFIGMDCIILKGVTIGSNTIIAAASVVTKSIPDNQIWGGNPAKFIKNNVSS